MKSIFIFLCALLLGVAGIAKDEAKMRTVSLTGRNTVYLSPDVDTASIVKDMAHILVMRDGLPQDQTLFIVIKSRGGLIDQAKSLAQAISQLKKIELICDECVSAAGAIFELTPHKRLVFDGSRMLMHEVRYEKFTARDAFQAKIDELKRTSEWFNKIFYTKLGMAKADYEKKIAGKDWNVYGNDIVLLGLADELVKIKCDETIKVLLPSTCEE